MKRINWREVWRAYLETGATPIQKRYIDRTAGIVRGACAYGALCLMSEGEAMIGVREVDDLYNAYSPEYTNGFIIGFDSGKESDVRDCAFRHSRWSFERLMQGYRDGRLCWIQCRERWAALQRRQSRVRQETTA